jgi:beta-N-acetylhexosaminidase
MTPAIFGISGLTLTEEERAFFAEADPAGYILFGRNIESRAQVRALTDELRALHGRDRLLISIDQEGGRVQRMKPPEWPKYPAGSIFAALWDIAPASAIEAARANAEALALDLADVGITANYHAPFDVRRPETDDAIGDRALGSEAKQVAALGRAVLDGHMRAGVRGCLKHMPGHGRATVDSHKKMPVVDASAEELEVDIAPFRALSDARLGMTCHIQFTAWDADHAATHSPFVIEQIIRKRIGFGGLLLTDDLDMEALGGSVPERAEKAIAAGCDIALNCWAKMDDMIGIAERLPTMSDTVRQRLEAALDGTGIADQTGAHAELIAKRDALLGVSGASA